MTNGTQTSNCGQTCWIIAAILGVVLAALLLILGSWGFLQAAFAGIVAAVILGFLLPRFFCSDASQHTGSGAAMGAAAAGAGAVAASAASGASARSTDAGASLASSAGAASDVVADDESLGDVTSSASVAVASTAPSTTTASKAFQMQPSKPLAGQAELAARKGDWKYEAADAGEAKAPAKKKAVVKKAPAKKTAAKTSGAKTTSAKASTAKAADAKTAAGKTTKAKSTAAKSKAAGSGAAKASAAKSGATKTTGAKASAAKSTRAKAVSAKDAAKGGDAASRKPAASKPLKAGATSKTGTTAKAKRPPVAADGKPPLMKKARAGGADDLKLISGVGPKLEGTLNELGFWHFDQVAGWRKKEVEWVDQRLKFKGRIERDGWIAQAKILAKGGETEFSKRSKKK